MTRNFDNKNLANNLANQILNDLQQGNNLTAAHILQASMNILMQAERNLHLEQHPNDKGNGSLISEKVCKVVIYVIIGIDFTGHKSL